MEQWIAALDDDNVEAWRVFHQISTRFVIDRGATAVVLEPILRGREPWDAEDLIERLAILHDAIYPPKGSPDGA